MIQDFKDPRRLTWVFTVSNVQPLQQYLDHKIASLPRSNNDLNGEVLQTIIDYDYVYETLKMQSHLLLGDQRKPSHYGTFIPFKQLEGSHSANTTLAFTDENIIIQHRGERYTYPMPERNDRGEVAIKGGLARVIAKLAFGLSVDDELPVRDVDLVTFGESKAFSKDELKRRYGVEPKDIERIDGGINQYLGDRDQSLNEVVVTNQGLVLSLNALSALFQRSTEASADPVKTIFGSHVINISRAYFEEGADVADYFIVNNTRFPSPKALSRMYKDLVEGKVDGITIPQGSLKMDVGIYWLVMARKFLKTADPEKRDRLLNRMVRLAGIVNSRYFQDDYLDDEQGPSRFLQSVETKTSGGEKFSMNGDLNDKETLDWIAVRLVRQILQKSDRYFGYDREKKFEQKLTAEDLQPIQLVLLDEDSQPTTPPINEEKQSAKNRAEAFFRLFGTKISNDQEATKSRIQAYLEHSIPVSNAYKGCDVYTIPIHNLASFAEAGRKMRLFKGANINGMNLPSVDIAFIVDRGYSELEYQHILFEELFHQTGVHEIATTHGTERVNGFTQSIYDRESGTFFEEGLSHVVWQQYCQDEGIPYHPTYIYESLIFGRALEEIFRRMPDGGRSVHKALLGARLLDETQRQVAMEQIDAVFGDGFFAKLMSIRSLKKDPSTIRSVYKRLSLPFSFER